MAWSLSVAFHCHKKRSTFSKCLKKHFTISLPTSLASMSPHSPSHTPLPATLSFSQCLWIQRLSFVPALLWPGPASPPSIPALLPSQLSLIINLQSSIRCKSRYHFLLGAFPDSPLSWHLSHFIIYQVSPSPIRAQVLSWPYAKSPTFLQIILSTSYAQSHL